MNWKHLWIKRLHIIKSSPKKHHFQIWEDDFCSSIILTVFFYLFLLCLSDNQNCKMLLKGLKKDTLTCWGMSQFQQPTELSKISKARQFSLMMMMWLWLINSAPEENVRFNKSEIELAPRYTLITLLTLFTQLKLLYTA